MKLGILTSGTSTNARDGKKAARQQECRKDELQTDCRENVCSTDANSHRERENAEIQGSLNSPPGERERDRKTETRRKRDSKGGDSKGRERQREG